MSRSSGAPIECIRPHARCTAEDACMYRGEVRPSNQEPMLSHVTLSHGVPKISSTAHMSHDRTPRQVWLQRPAKSAPRVFVEQAAPTMRCCAVVLSVRNISPPFSACRKPVYRNCRHCRHGAYLAQTGLRHRWPWTMMNEQILVLPSTPEGMDMHRHRQRLL